MGPQPQLLSLPRLCLLLLLLLFSFLAGAQAQRLGLPEETARNAGERATSAQLAVSDWSRDDLRRWWAELRAMDGSQGALPQALQPPVEPAAWSPVRLPDFRQRSASGGRLEDEPRFQMRWYRFSYVPPEGRWPTSVALYMPRVVGMAAAVLVRTEEGWRPGAVGASAVGRVSRCVYREAGRARHRGHRGGAGAGGQLLLRFHGLAGGA
jgi:hypothetical protein